MRVSSILYAVALLCAAVSNSSALAQAPSTVTLGETDVLRANDSQNGNMLLAQHEMLSQPATINSLSFYVTSAAGNLLLGIYDATGPNGGPGALQAQTGSFTPAAGWNTASVITPVALPAGNYWLAYLPSDDGLGFVKQNNSGNCVYSSSSFSGGLPATFAQSPSDCAPTTWSFYATLTVSGGAAVSGICGAANGAALTSAPAGGLCSAGTASAVFGNGPWTWSCAGSTGGTTAQCLASLASSPVNGACGPANGGAVNSVPTGGLCSAGVASAVSGNGPWSWSCAGGSGGATAQCSASLASSAVNGACGPANGGAVNSAPTAGLCSAGVASAVGGSGPWMWTCAGSNGGTTASCLAQLAVSSGGSGNSGLLPSDRDARANWQMAGMLSVGGIPNRTTVCATVNPIGGGNDDTSKIQAAIEACPAGQVVSLTAGTFTISEGNYVQVDRGITLRGAGPRVTTLTRTGGAALGSDAPGSNPSPMIILGPLEYNNNQTPTTLTADGAAGEYSVQVDSASGFSIGQIVMIDEASGASWQPDVIWASAGYSQIWAAPDYRVVWQKHNPSYADVDDFSASEYPNQAGTAGCWFSNCDRPTAEIHRISAISGSTITFDSPLTISYRVSHQAQLYYWQTPFTANAGVENMTVEDGDDDNIDFNWCVYCWANNVENTLWLGAGFGVNNSFRVQLEAFYNHEPVWPVPGGGGYNISLAAGSSEILIENGISVLANKVMVERAAGAGSVVAYNYMDDGFISGTDTWQEVGLNGSHYVGSHHTLFEGNYAFNIDSDQTHGNSIYHTFFRNYASGFRAKFTDYLNNTVVDDIAQQSTNGPLRAAGGHAYAYWFSFIGNVFGTPGAMSGWIYNGLGALNDIPNQSIWMLGWMDIVPQGYDPNVAATAIQDGNFDYVTNSVSWAASDTAHTLPDSLYLTRKPAFFDAGSGYTWPWVNPTGTPQLYTLPAKARYDAGTPFTQP